MEDKCSSFALSPLPQIPNIRTDRQEAERQRGRQIDIAGGWQCGTLSTTRWHRKNPLLRIIHYYSLRKVMLI